MIGMNHLVLRGGHVAARRAARSDRDGAGVTVDGGALRLLLQTAVK